MKNAIMLLVVFSVFVIGCENGVIEVSDDTGKLADPYYCEVDSDCIVKNVGNCCGYYPRCVNVQHEPDLEAVQKECQEKKMVSVCGWPEITDCECRANKCESLQDGTVV